MIISGHYLLPKHPILRMMSTLCTWTQRHAGEADGQKVYFIKVT